MKSKNLLISGVMVIAALVVIAGYLMFNMSIPSVFDEDEVTTEELDDLIAELEMLDDIESELNLDDEDLDIDI